jgi:uncharacterized membrane protein YqgA involved in biofilm formation
MIGLGTIINTASIIGAGIVGHFAGNLFKEEQQESVGRVCGISVLFIAIAGAMEGMLKPDGGALTATNTMLVVICVVLGTVIGELMRIESWFISFGEWLKKKTGNEGDRNFVNAFVTASLTVSIGAMAIVGSIEDGISQDYTTLALKSVLDFVIIVVMTSSLGKGCAFSAIPVFVFEGCMTLFAHLISPIMTAAAVANLSMIGSILIFCVGVNLVWDTKLRVANMLPAVILAVMAGLLPI